MTPKQRRAKADSAAAPVPAGTLVDPHRLALGDQRRARRRLPPGDDAAARAPHERGRPSGRPGRRARIFNDEHFKGWLPKGLALRDIFARLSTGYAKRFWKQGNRYLGETLYLDGRIR